MDHGVHPRGARHMIDPAVLMEGVRAVYGTEVAARDYGELVPVPAERVVTTSDGMVIELGGRPLRFMDTPGHARHHHCIWDEASRGWFKYLSLPEQYEYAEKYIKLLNIATPSADQPVKNLSGGNQQKVILARWLAINPQILILDEPTRGIDVGTKAEIQKLVLSLAEEGKSCVFISSELEEVLRTSHRIVVLREREKVAEYAGEVDESTIIHAFAGSEA